MTRIPPVLSTASLILRPLTDGDGPVLEPLLNDPVVREMFHWAVGQRSSGADCVTAQIKMQGVDAVPVRSYSWAITLAGTETAIGFAQLGNITFHTGAEPALALNSQNRSHGYGLEIMNELIRWGFEDMVPDWARTSDGEDTGARLPKMTALAMPHNTPSVRMLSRTLMTDKGVIESPAGMVKVRAFSLTRQQYRQQQASARD